MNELLKAIDAEIDKLTGTGNELDDKIANSLFRIVFDTRLNIARTELLQIREDDMSDPLDNNHTP